MNKVRVGGQAVIEGVMMRSQNTMTVAVRKPDGSIKVKEEFVSSLAERFPILKKPFFRGVVILIESMVYGIGALTFSANEAVEEEEKTSDKGGGGEISPWMTAVTIIVSFAFAILLFVVVPHFATLYIGEILPVNMGIETFTFHLIDGILKVSVFLIYIISISLIPDIKRVFMYHGAEHKSIFTYEAGEELSVDNARKYSTFHPRCGTSFIILVLLISIVIFAVTFPFLPLFPDMNKILKNFIYILIKIPLLVPIAGISYEVIRLAGEKRDNVFLKAISIPGLWIQKITTREPTDDQVEVALAALTKAVDMELSTGAKTPRGD